MSEQACEADFSKAVEVVTAIADTDRVAGHATSGRGEGGHISELAAAKAEAEKHRARKLELQNAQLEGRLIDRDSVEQTAAQILGDLRVALLAIGVRLAPRVAGMADQKAVARLIEDEIGRTLTSFADPDDFFERVALS
ncbi:hypothetical protein [Bradyrhizobium sp. BRP56]|uniref:hypothetical protein n=1 Tax=Bradyrhizobium sp. BRP56 TaxID=2793819 RepID=UPI001CD70711|nr:hypothetical protein [Bradyrhizobium sp. BRP56]MCA1401926.1 hypothetical protein [Bradyrhizobium sp. BRP56]